MNNFILHSGGAIGSDRAWDQIGQKAGLLPDNINHYYLNTKTPFGNFEINTADFIEGKAMVKKANSILHRRPDNYMNLLARNWCQIKYSEATFAIANSLDLNTNIVGGGTGWAVAMSIIVEHPTYVFNQSDSKWYFFSSASKHFIECDTPSLTKNFAGIGTREIQSNGQFAIVDCYSKTIHDIKMINGKIKIEEHENTI